METRAPRGPPRVTPPKPPPLLPSSNKDATNGLDSKDEIDLSNTLFRQTLPLTEDRYCDLVSTLLSRLFHRLVQPVAKLAEAVGPLSPLA